MCSIRCFQMTLIRWSERQGERGSINCDPLNVNFMPLWMVPPTTIFRSCESATRPTTIVPDPTTPLPSKPIHIYWADIVRRKVTLEKNLKSLPVYSQNCPNLGIMSAKNAGMVSAKCTRWEFWSQVHLNYTRINSTRRCTDTEAWWMITGIISSNDSEEQDMQPKPIHAPEYKDMTDLMDRAQEPISPQRALVIYGG